MNFFNMSYILSYIRHNNGKSTIKSHFSSKNLIYDYNEVQELFHSHHNYQVFVAGPSGLHKTDMLKTMISNLISQGVCRDNIFYLDCTLPFIRTISLIEIINYFSPSRNILHNLYLIINEIQLMPNWKDELSLIHNDYPFVKVLSSCSVPHFIYEHTNGIVNSYSKVVVLSKKNVSNTKTTSDTFGVYDNLKYNIKNNVGEIKGMTSEGKIKEIHIIPNAIHNITVKVISSGAFHHRPELSEIIIPDSIEYIGDYAFTNCTNLRRVVLPKNLKYIGECAFCNTTNLEFIEGGENVIHIGNSAFLGSKWLNNNQDEFISIGRVLYQYNGKNSQIVTVPKKLKVIGYYAFANSKIKGIDLSGVSKVNEGAFYNCFDLENIQNLNISLISSFQFYNCTSLKSVKTVIKKTGRFSFYNCSQIEQIFLHENFILEANSFENCTKLKSIHRNIQENKNNSIIHSCSFWNTKLESFNFENIKKIGQYAFYNNNLTSLHVTSPLKIEDYAFSCNHSLVEVIFNEHCLIGEAILYNSMNIKKATLSGTYALNYYFGTTPKILELHIKGSKCISNYCRDNNYIKSIYVECKTIENWAFYNNKNLSEIILHVENIGAWAFAYCSSITEVVIPKDVTYIEMNCFRYCKNLSKITILTDDDFYFGANAFYSTSIDKVFYVSKINKYMAKEIWKEYHSNLKEMDNNNDY